MKMVPIPSIPRLSIESASNLDFVRAAPFFLALISFLFLLRPCGELILKDLDPRLALALVPAASIHECEERGAIPRTPSFFSRPVRHAVIYSPS